MSIQVVKTRVKQFFATLAVATANNPILLEGEVYIEKNATTGRSTGRRKVGDGVIGAGDVITGTAFNDLPFEPSADGAALPDGGTTGQLLAKASDDDQDTEWIDAPEGGTSLSLPTEEEARDGTTTTARAWSSLRARQAAEAWYLTQAPPLDVDGFFVRPYRLEELLDYIAPYMGFTLLTASDIGASVAGTNDQRFANSFIPLGVASNSASIKGAGQSWTVGGVTSAGTNRGCYTLTINSTAAFSLDVSDALGNSGDNWEAEIRITTTQVPVSFSFTGIDTVIAVPGSTLADNPFAAGGVTSLYLAKRNATSLTAQFSPATVVP